METAQNRCVGDRNVSLPVVNGGKPSKQGIRKSKSGPRRAVVLVVVNLLFIAHIVVWVLSRKYGWFDGGNTLTPIEPSEAMDFVKDGVINAGLIFFAIALVATLILGRWFCGWGCHIVALQDACGWFMKKLGIRPKPFRSRLLIYIPLILALYMFVWPILYRVAVAPWIQPDLLAPGLSAHLTTTEFWRTFPTWIVAIPFLAICGFGAVYFLGSKGFCTYGCPYGGFFAPLDELAIGRIRVTDACEQCGHCTAVCTSNVRVHHEVREYGMVVDMGCMKCLDCVSVCPNDALYYGLGKPGSMAGQPVNEAPKRTYDLTWPEEIGMASVFALCFFAVRGAYGIVPLLMAAGTAGCVTFIVWKLWKLLRVQNVSLYRFRLKLHGKITRSGVLYSVFALLICLLVVHTGIVNLSHFTGGWFGRKVPQLPIEAFSGQVVEVDDATQRNAARAIAAYTLGSNIGNGGIGIPWPRGTYKQNTWQAHLDYRIATAQLHSLQYAQAEQTTARAIAREGPSEPFCTGLFWVMRAQGRQDEALSYALDVLDTQTEYANMLRIVADWSSQIGTTGAVIDLCDRRLARDSTDAPALLTKGRLLLQTGQTDEGLAVLRKRVELLDDEAKEPARAAAHAEYGRYLAAHGRLDEAIAFTQSATELAPKNVAVLLQQAELLEAAGRPDQAVQYRRRAEQLSGKR
jgi:polyferredoxin